MDNQIQDKIKEINNLIIIAINLQKIAKKVSTACNIVNNSWSGSDLVGHANLFYQNFETPSAHKRFNVEWGLIRGIPDGWNEKNDTEIRIQIQPKDSFDFEKFDNEAEEIENKFEEIRKSIILLISKYSRENSKEIEKFILKNKTDIFNDYWKRQLITRDTKALYAGRQVPTHKYFEAAALFLLGVVDQLKDFLFVVEKATIDINRLPVVGGVVKNSLQSFVDRNTLLRLSKIENKDFDISRLISLCKELDDNFGLENYYSCSMLLRAILDHIPPIFKKKSFLEVSTQYGSKSFKDIMKPLEDTARKISDNYLHTQVDTKVLSINRTQISFQANLDILLNEIANRLG